MRWIEDEDAIVNLEEIYKLLEFIYVEFPEFSQYFLNVNIWQQ